MPHNLDPIRAIASVITNSDVLIRAANAAGLRVDLTVTGEDDWSHTTRIRALIPRIFQAYDALTDEERIAAAQAAFGSLAVQAPAEEALNRLGWNAIDGHLTVSTPDVREVFFPRGSQWDAFVVLRGVFAEANNTLLIVDPFCDGTVFEILGTRADLTALQVRILCRQNAAAVSAEGNRFTLQHAGVAIEVRRTDDFHDRFVVIDGTACVHIGSSLNHAGTRAFMISRVEDDQNRTSLLTQIQASWNAGTVVP